MIYFVQADANGPIKIGFTTNAPGRVQALRSANPCKLHLIGVDDGGVERERALHRRFGVYALRGEWFEPHDELIRFVRSLPPIPPGIAEACSYVRPENQNVGGRPLAARETPTACARSAWFNHEDHRTDQEALDNMSGWSRSAAYRAFGPSGRPLRGRPKGAGVKRYIEKGGKIGRELQMTEEARATVLRMFKEGASAREAGKAVGVTPQCIYKYFPGGPSKYR